MTLDQHLADLQVQYNVIAQIDLSKWDNEYEKSSSWLLDEIKKAHKEEFDNNERIVFVHQHDYYVNDNQIGIILKAIQVYLNEVDISNFFAVIISTNPDIYKQGTALNSMSSDPVHLTYVYADGEFTATKLDRHPASRREEYQYGSANPINISLHNLSDRHRFLLSESKTFCMYPWIHLHAYPTGEVHPCCHAEWKADPVGNARKNTLEEIWHGPGMSKLRTDMLSETPHSSCTRCYEQEASGFFSGRQSANKHHGHHVAKVDNPNPDFEMTYWDIRFSNLCNLRCRTCGPTFSSQWYQDQILLAGEGWGKNNRVLNIAGRNKDDMWEQLIPHLDHVEKIYFAGGEPLLMEEHYNILEELLHRNKTHVKLIYNTNFTHTQLKDRSVFEYWKLFDSVAVGASLDGMGAYAEYIRKGTDWAQVEQNRRDMMAICPQVDFYISPTLSIMNAVHLPEFHRAWVDKGYIKPQDLNVNILQDGEQYRIDIATPEYKSRIQQLYEEHLEWLRPLDRLNRATVGFESAIKFLNATDNSHLLPKFWKKTEELDEIRKENILDVIPELKALK